MIRRPDGEDAAVRQQNRRSNLDRGGLHQVRRRVPAAHPLIRRDDILLRRGMAGAVDREDRLIGEQRPGLFTRTGVVLVGGSRPRVGDRIIDRASAVE